VAAAILAAVEPGFQPGGISVALALALPMGPEREIILAVTYILVVFSIVVQGLTIQHVVQRVLR
jgi:monovalent cation:H+ antiporter, CPA1 family